VVSEEVPRFKNVAKLYPDWHQKARCLGTDDSLFFGSGDPDVRPPYTLAEISNARAICAECPVARECLTTALKNREEYGVWAGSTRKQRKAILIRVKTGVTTLPDEVEEHVTRLGRVHIKITIKGVVRE
jgi:WhiB family transcriptional regulator, redox-sensing transcriptional regulator